MSIVIDCDEGEEAVCPFRGGPCVTECMLMRPTGLGEPRCSFRVIADELVLASGGLRELQKQADELCTLADKLRNKSKLRGDAE